jgi:hypothetical protein
MGFWVYGGFSRMALLRLESQFSSTLVDFRLPTLHNLSVYGSCLNRRIKPSASLGRYCGSFDYQT